MSDELTPEAQPEAPPEPPPVPPPRRPWGASVVSMVCLILLGWTALAYSPLARYPMARMASAMAAPWVQLDNEEGALLWQTMELAEGRSIYRTLEREPFVVGTYPPLFMAMAAPFVDRDAPSLLSGRAISTWSAMIITLGIAVTLLLRRRNLLIAWVAALLFFCTLEVNNWSGYFRVDMLAVALSAGGVMLASAAKRFSTPVRIVVGTMFVLAFFTKQTQLAAPMAIVLWLLAREGWRGGVRFGLGFGAAVALVLAALSVLTHGQFLLNTVSYNVNTYHPRDVWAIWLPHIWRFYPGLVTAGVTLLGASLVLRNWPPPEAGNETNPPPLSWRGSPLPWYMLTSLMQVVAIGKEGSAENYLLEPLAAWALGTGDLLAAMLRAQAVTPASAHRRRLIFARAMALFVCAALAAQAVHMNRRKDWAFSRGEITIDQAAVWSSVAQQVRGERGETWCELAMFNLLANRSPLLQPFIMSELARQGVWDQKPFLNDLVRGRFALIVTAFDVASPDPTNVYTPEMLQAMRLNYRLVGRIEGAGLWNYYLYRPVAPPTAGNIARARVAEDFNTRT